MTKVTPLTQSSTDDLRASLEELALDHSGLEKKYKIILSSVAASQEKNR